MRHLLQRWLIGPIAALLSQGITPQKIALSIAVGAIVGIFPVLGTTTVLCTLAAATLRLNLIAVHTVHYAMTPVQVLLIIPFVRVGEHLLGAAPQPLSVSGGMDLIAHGALHAIVVLWDAIVHAIVGWLAIGPVAIALGYWIAKKGLQATTERKSRGTGHGLPAGAEAPKSAPSVDCSP
jgi:uncharacterized protein (DUF2062 family)